MTSRPEEFPDVDVRFVDDGHDHKCEVRVDLAEHDGPRDELVHRARSTETALMEAGRGVEYALEYGDVHDDPAARGRRFVRAVYDHPEIAKAQYRPWTQEVWLTVTTMDTDLWSELAWFAGLDERWWRIDFKRDHGIVLDLEYAVRPFAPPVPDEAWTDARERFHDRESTALADPDRHADLRDEYAGEKEIIRNPAINDGAPRIAGTEALAYHIHYLDQTHDDLMEVVSRVYPRLDERDVELALEYARAHPEEAEAYLDEQRERNERIEELLDGDG